MLSRYNNSLWMPEEVGQEQSLGHEQSAATGMLPMMRQEAGPHHDQHLLAMASGGAGDFRAPGMLDDDWYFSADTHAGGDADADAAARVSMAMVPASMGASCSGPGFGASSQMFPLLNLGGAGPFDVSGFDLGGSGNVGGDFMAFLGAGNASNSAPISLLTHGNTGFLGSFGGFGPAPPQLAGFGGLAGFDTAVARDGSGSSSEAPAAPASMTTPFSGRGNAAVLRPLETFPPVGAQPTLFQKRALRRNAGEEDDDKKRMAAVGALSVGRDTVLEDVDEDVLSIDASGMNYNSETEDGRGVEESARKDSNANSTVTGGAGGAAEGKGNRKGMPAKNLMAERRRRKKLNDRLYMLRSVVPKISKMDRASILGDAIEYLKELLQKINDLQNELEPSASTSSLPPTPTSFHPLTPTLPTLPSRVKEELCPSALALPSPTAGQQPSVEVRLREGGVVNIHMLCARRPGLLLSAMKAIEALGLDVQQAVISCFNGFALDVFKAEQCNDGPGLQPEEIKAVLLQSAGYHPVI
uniref:Uncharacterized protein n=1 Tax=Avena sativa TaxID=4498 RepID=A0ACD6AEH0_AVESA